MFELLTAIGTVGLAVSWLVVIWIMLRAAWNALTKPAPPTYEMVEAMGRLADAEREPFRGKMPTLTEQERLAHRQRLYLISDKVRGRARIAALPPSHEVKVGGLTILCGCTCSGGHDTRGAFYTRDVHCPSHGNPGAV